MEKLTVEERQRRSFSESFKRKKVQEIETGQVKISEICRAYQISTTGQAPLSMVFFRQE